MKTMALETPMKAMTRMTSALVVARPGASFFLKAVVIVYLGTDRVLLDTVALSALRRRRWPAATADCLVIWCETARRNLPWFVITVAKMVSRSYSLRVGH